MPKVSFQSFLVFLVSIPVYSCEVLLLLQQQTHLYLESSNDWAFQLSQIESFFLKQWSMRAHMSCVYTSKHICPADLQGRQSYLFLLFFIPNLSELLAIYQWLKQSPCFQGLTTCSSHSCPVVYKTDSLISSAPTLYSFLCCSLHFRSQQQPTPGTHELPATV